MRTLSTFATLLVCISSSALAGDQIEFGPAPSWATSSKIPEAGSAKDGPAVLPLLYSQHVRVERGRTTIHSKMAMKFLSPEGLAAGRISVQWRPDKDAISVHRLVILRNGREIDLLASGKKFELLRREANLEQATLDGQLTAVMQPEDLQVGDTIVLSMTLASADPVLGHHAELILGFPNEISAKLVQLRVDWPVDLALNHRFYEMPDAKVSQNGNWQSVQWMLAEPAIYTPPKGAPVRFHLGRRLEFTDFANWKDLSDLFRPIFDKASVVPASGPLRDEVEKIRRGSTDPKARASAALALVEDKVRYVNVVLGQGNYVPASAADTWQRRFGDCKAKTALLVAILKELGIAAVPVLVSALVGDGLDQRLPTITQFDHVIVRTTIGGRDYWLDATRMGDSNIDLLATPYFAWGLPLVPNALLVPIQPSSLDRPHTETTIAIDASGGADKPAPTRIERIFRADQAVLFNAVMANIQTNARDKALREYWKDQLSDFNVSQASGTFTRDKAEYRLAAEGTMKLELSEGRYEVDVPTPGFKPDFEREAGPHNKAPFAVPFPHYTRWVQTIIVPETHARLGLSNDNPIDRTLAGRRYRRTMSKEGNLFRIEISDQSLASEIPYAEAVAAEEELRKLDGMDYYVTLAERTNEEMQTLLDRKPSSARGYMTRGKALAKMGRDDEAIRDFGEAVKLDPKNIDAYAERGLSRLQLNDFAGARSDLLAADKLGGTTYLIEVVTAREAAAKGDWKSAIASTTAILNRFPSDTYHLMARAGYYHRTGDIKKALADTLAVTRLNTNDTRARLMRMNLYSEQQNERAVLAEADVILKLNLQDTHGYVAAAKTYAAYGRQADVDRAFAMALKLKPEGYIYLNRAETRPKADRAGRRADIDLALKLEPENPSALEMMGDLLTEQKDYRGALTEYDAAVKKDPSYPRFRLKRGITNIRLGEPIRADADFAFVRAEAEKNYAQLNLVCWVKAKAGVALESALVDCDMALKLNPKAAEIHDSRGLVLLRLGRLDDAIAAYSTALELSKGLSFALFGRAMAFERKGDISKATADARAATAKNRRIRESYHEMGLELKVR